MYRDEQEALKARREALSREKAEVDERLKAIKDLKENGVVKPYQTVFTVALGIMLMFSFGAMWSMIVFDTPAKPELAPEPDASASLEHGPIAIPQSSEDADQMLQSTTADCDGADNDCDTANDNGLDIVFVLDTSGSMTPYLENTKLAISAYAKGATAASYALMTTYTDNSRGVPFLTSDPETFIRFVAQSCINPSVDHEYIPLRMEEAANLGHNLVVAFTDEPPMVPTDRYYDYAVNRRMGLYGLCARNNGTAFTVFTTPQNVSAWRELGSCIRVYGEL